MEQEKYDDKCSLIMLGDAGVGKSTLSISYKCGYPLDKKTQATIGFDLWTKIVNVDDKKVKALIYDTSGQEVFNCITKNYIRQGEGILIVYDITDLKSFESVMYWEEEVKEHRCDNPFICIVGNKADLEDQRQVSQEAGQKLANRLGASFIETSCKDMITIDQAFTIVIKQIYSQKIERNSEITARLSRSTRKCEKRKQGCPCK
ncbi:unnamed protein product [Moneuplotes crassus]|uniref:Uncharacterized protein n=1 Tax=Euplotes crassus TaxID=5936 RepID=A0AAD2D3L4_EUPCR|nr:unnamed protein product [Moneuplotes crassus]